MKEMPEDKSYQNLICSQVCIDSR